MENSNIHLKDVLKQGDKIHGERLPCRSFTCYDGYNDEKGNWVTEFVVAAKHSNEHETMKRKEMMYRYENKMGV
jgi:hypothetical protein